MLAWRLILILVGRISHRSVVNAYAGGGVRVNPEAGAALEPQHLGQRPEPKPYKQNKDTQPSQEI